MDCRHPSLHTRIPQECMHLFSPGVPRDVDQSYKENGRIVAGCVTLFFSPPAGTAETIWWLSGAFIPSLLEMSDKNIRPLTDEKAVEWAADMLGEARSRSPLVLISIADFGSTLRLPRLFLLPLICILRLSPQVTTYSVAAGILLLEYGRQKIIDSGKERAAKAAREAAEAETAAQRAAEWDNAVRTERLLKEIGERLYKLEQAEIERHASILPKLVDVGMGGWAWRWIPWGRSRVQRERVVASGDEAASSDSVDVTLGLPRPAPGPAGRGPGAPGPGPGPGPAAAPTTSRSPVLMVEAIASSAREA